jgi:addiction module RelE/StbE family toxin
MKHYIQSKTFLKKFDKLPAKKQYSVLEAIELFKITPTAPSLRNHRLSGKLRKYWSISAGGDMRVHYVSLRNGDIIITFVDVGTHSQLY